MRKGPNPKSAARAVVLWLGWEKGGKADGVGAKESEMRCHVGLDVSKRYTSICVVDANGEIQREGRVETSPKAIVSFLRGQGRRYSRIGMEASSIAPWLYEGLVRNGLPVICIETRHAHGVLKAQPNKTDRDDAVGIANLMRTGTYRLVHIKTPQSQRIRAMLTARRLLKTKFLDIQNGIRELLLGFGMKLDPGGAGSFTARVLSLVRRDTGVSDVIGPLVSMCLRLDAEIKGFDERLAAMAADDPVCRLLITVPGVGPFVALTYRTAIDVPERFSRSRSVGPHLGLVPRTFQSGDIERRGHVSKHGDRGVRAALFIAAMVLMKPRARTNWLKTWGQQVAERRGKKRAIIAVARRLAVVMHRMWLTGTPFRWESAL